MTADGENWLLINASPDLPQQLRQSKALHPRAATRGSPIKAVVLTGAEIDQVAGLLSLREREPFEIYATAATLGAVADNPMFGALAPDLVKRHAVVPGAALTLPGGLSAQLFTAPGKVPLYLEGEELGDGQAGQGGPERLSGPRSRRRRPCRFRLRSSGTRARAPRASDHAARAFPCAA